MAGKTTETQTDSELTADIIKRSEFTDVDALREIADFDSAVALVAQAMGGVVAADTELGDGFTLLSENGKDRLVGVPLLIMEWTFNDGDYGIFVSMRVVAKHGGTVGKYIVNDGSTGIRDQLAEFSRRTNRVGGLIARNGLRRSDYEYPDPQTGEMKPAHTYYIDTSA